jgi:putative DNA primase/helicase
LPILDSKEVIACQNGLLDSRTRKLHPHTPQFWSAHVVDYPNDSNADAPRFIQFLDETWPVDDEAQWLALELIGISLTRNTRFQKFWQIIGRSGTGKGTYLKLLKGMVGASAYVGTDLQAFGGRFGMEGLLGKKVVVFGDARMNGISAEARNNILTRLLGLSAGDDVSVQQKNEKDSQGVLDVVMIIASNVPIAPQDASLAIMRRLITQETKNSLDGREDSY